MKISGIGQPVDSPVSKSAMFVVTASAVVSKDPIYAETFCDLRGDPPIRPGCIAVCIGARAHPCLLQ